MKNGAPWLARALASTRDQGVPFELIVVDDGSVDDSVAIARAWPGARVVPAVGRGAAGGRNSAAAARNTGLRAANTEWLQFLDADDRLAPQKLDRQLAAASPSADIVFSEIRAVFDALGDHSVPETFRRHRPRRDWVAAFGRINVLAVHAPIIRRRALLELGGFPEDLGIQAPDAAGTFPPVASALMAVDWLLWARAALHGCEFQFVPGLAGYYHHHSRAASADLTRLFRDELLALHELARLYAEKRVGARGQFALALGHERVARQLRIRGHAEEARAALEDSTRLIPSPLPDGVDTERDDHLRGLPPCLELADVDAYWSRYAAEDVTQPKLAVATTTTPRFAIAGCDTLTIYILRLFRVLSPAGRGRLTVRPVPVGVMRRALRAAAGLASARRFIYENTMRYRRRPWHVLRVLWTRIRKAPGSPRG